MGAWDVDTFDNDTAGDWAYELEGVTDLSYVQQSLNSVLENGDEYLDSDEACGGLAACEVIARLKGNWGKRDSYTETVDNWVESNPQSPPDELIRRALQTIDRIRTAPSELLELWEQSEAAEWQAAVENLRQRVEN